MNGRKSYGFTHVFLQPNYYATQAPLEDRMERAAALAQKYGTGIEIELFTTTCINGSTVIITDALFTRCICKKEANTPKERIL
ncbi:DUF4855 domain-containing protein [Thermincola ferriacetica]|uniref:DUF4855 domain-containing protein n=1 Tax=Thermincola ferriacetica TaxID=281456 RepID=UPI00068E17C5|nr:DUF4855 domain-containing protein [Thermincola ferriacetica]